MTVSTSTFPAASLVLVRQRPALGQAPEAWAKPIASSSAATLDVGRFAMQPISAATTPANLTVHREPPRASFELFLRLGNRSVSCGSFLGAA